MYSENVFLSDAEEKPGMKRDLRLNMAHLSDTAESIQNYSDRIEDLKTACQNFLDVLQKQDSVSYQTLSEEWEKGIIG